jgi:hypothetical protein
VRMSLSGRIDAGSLFREINGVFKRYGVGKGVGFVPDKVDVSMERATSGTCTLIYREFFSYLPPEVMAVAMGNAVEFLSSVGIPREKIKPLDSGVEVTLEGDARIAYFPMLEMLIQDKGIAGNVDSALDSLKASIRSMMDLFEFVWSWDAASEELWRNNIAKLNEVISANPGMQSEIEELVKKAHEKVV